MRPSRSANLKRREGPCLAYRVRVESGLPIISSNDYSRRVKILLLGSLVALIVRASPATMLLALAFVTWALMKRDDRSRSQRTFIIAALVPLCGVFPDLVTGLLLLTLLALDLSSTSSRSIVWAAPAIVLAGVWAATRFIAEFDIAPFVNLFAGRDGPGDAGVLNILRWLRGGPPGYYVAIEDCIRLILIASLWAVLPNSRGITFAKGLLAGGTLCAVLALMEWFAPESFSVVRAPSPFWKGINRMTALATDPNALGVLAGALIPVAFATLKERSWPVIVALVLGGLYSGSRTFFLLPVITAAYVVWRTKGTRFALLSMTAIGLFLAILIGSTSLMPQPPAGLVRIRESLDPTRISSTLESRTIFTRLSIEAFKSSPLLGVGLGRFDDYVVPLSHSLNLGTGLWRDGATSVYLEILCELGILGALVFTVVALSLKRADGADLVYRGLGIAFLIILVFMPHTNFPEGVALAGLLLAQNAIPRRIHARPLIAAVVAVSMALPFWYSPSAIYGFYPWEQNDQGYIRWTAAESGGALACVDSAELKLLNASPQVQDVEVRASNGSQLRTLQRGESLSVKLPCVKGSARYLINVSPGFTPSKFGFEGDERLLGVRQVAPQPVP